MDLYYGGTIDFTDGSNGIIQATEVDYKGVTIDTTASGAKFAENGNNVQVNVGTKFIIEGVSGATITIEWYDEDQPNLGSDENCTIDIDEDGVATITIVAGDGTTGGANGSIYLKKIIINYYD